MTAYPDLEAVLSGERRWCVICADCLDVLPQMPDGCVDHVITDPPYSEHVHSKARAGQRKVPLLDGNRRLSRCAYAREVTFGFGYLLDDDRAALAAAYARLATRWVLAFSDVESCHLWRRDMVVSGLDYARTGAWVKVGGTPQFTGDRPGAGFETITICHRRGRKRWNGGGSLGVWSHLTCIERGGQRIDNNSREHPTQKPLPLMEELVALFTDRDDLILDSHAGAGTTGVAALRLGRRVILIEREPKWAELCRERLQAEDEGSTLQARRAGQMPLFGEGE